MKITQTGFQDLLLFEPPVFTDERGYFMESYNKQTLEKLGVNLNFVQDNQSYSRKGVLRGLHFQKKPNGQTKLVRALAGTILDVVVDLRTNQPTYKKVYTVELSGENQKQLLVPIGFAHAFIVLSENASVLYKCDNYYNKSAEGGLHFNDPELNIDWKLPKDQMIISSKDLALPFLTNLNYQF
jgi:dTDP-4-dehydrorhamnose 3,5-epimerase